MSAVSVTPPTSPHASFSSVARLLAGLLPNSQPVDGAEAVLFAPVDTQPPRLISATVIEGRALRARRVFDAPIVGFTAFLDGTQQSHVACYLPGGIPIVYGTVGAVIRDRRNQRLFTWRHAVERRLYASRANLSSTVWRSLIETGIAVHDTSETDAPDEASEHPHALREAAVHRVQKDRELTEQSLALEWCSREDRPLLIDGGISAAEPVARATCAIGVVKTHRTLYASGEALVAVLGLSYAERSSVFLVTSPKRASVASWYLRIRDPRGHDPMWGLVRVEVAHPMAGGDVEVGRRADEVSRWILAEVSPVALPDGRWDKMVYGVRDCEEFLRAVM
jgi:hypothetical protein